MVANIRPYQLPLDELDNIAPIGLARHIIAHNIQSVQLTIEKSNQFPRLILLQRGQAVYGHRHNFDHLTWCWHGRLAVERLDMNEPDDMPEFEKTVTDRWVAEPGDPVAILKGANHRLVGLAENTVAYCVYAHRNPEGEVIPYNCGFLDAYR